MLEEDGVLADARAKAGLSDFGDESFREPLRVLLRDLVLCGLLLRIRLLLRMYLLLVRASLLCIKRSGHVPRRHHELLEMIPGTRRFERLGDHRHARQDVAHVRRLQEGFAPRAAGVVAHGLSRGVDRADARCRGDTAGIARALVVLVQM